MQTGANRCKANTPIKSSKIRTYTNGCKPVQTSAKWLIRTLKAESTGSSPVSGTFRINSYSRFTFNQLLAGGRCGELNRASIGIPTAPEDPISPLHSTDTSLTASRRTSTTSVFARRVQRAVFFPRRCSLAFLISLMSPTGRISQVVPYFSAGCCAMSCIA